MNSSTVSGKYINCTYLHIHIIYILYTYYTYYINPSKYQFNPSKYQSNPNTNPSNSNQTNSIHQYPISNIQYPISKYPVEDLYMIQIIFLLHLLIYYFTKYPFINSIQFNPNTNSSNKSNYQIINMYNMYICIICIIIQERTKVQEE